MRSIILRSALMLTLLALASPAAMAEEITDPQWGFAVRTLDGWVAQKQTAGVLMGSETETGLVMVERHDYADVAALRIAAQEGYQDAGTQLRLEGQVESFGENGVGARFVGTVEGEQAKAYAVGLVSPHGGGVLVLSLVAASDGSDAYVARAATVAKSVSFSKQEVASEVEEWRQWFAGARLTYMWSYYSGGGADGSYAGGSQKTVIDLCEQGYFNYYDGNTMSIDGGFGSGYNATMGGGGTTSGNGEWVVQGRGAQTILVLSFHDGTVYEYVLTYEDNKTYLNDDRFFVTRDGSIDADQAPDCY